MDNAVLNHCLELIRLRDHDRYLTLLMTPDAARMTLIPLYAFQTEIARIRETVSEPMLGQIRLQWWRETIDQLFDGPPPRGHEVVEALAVPIAAGLYEREGLQGLIDGREQDLDDGMFTDLPDLLSYLHNTSMLLMVVAGRALLKEKLNRAFTPEEAEAVQLIGEAYGLTGILRSIGPMASQGRVMLPESLLAKHEVETADILAGTCRPGLRALIEEMAGEAETHCVLNTVMDIANQFSDSRYVEKLVWLSDATSPVPDPPGTTVFSDRLKSDFSTLKAKGMKVATTAATRKATMAAEPT